MDEEGREMNGNGRHVGEIGEVEEVFKDAGERQPVRPEY